MSSSQSITEFVDVLVVGGGPVGLITAYQLARNLPRSEYKIKIIEQHDKSSQDRYGRAITLFPRSVEMLDQLGLADELAQQCFACRQTANYDKHGQEAPNRGWSFAEDMKDTTWNFALVLRQKYQEDIFRRALKRQGVEVDTPYALTGIKLLDNTDLGSHRILATIKHGLTKVTSTIKCRYLIGADGGRSFIRRAMDIPFDGSTSENTWVRVDGVVETNLPKPRGYCGIESPTHGNVLWQAMDHGSTRIGFALNPERQALYEVFNQEAAVKEAIEAVKPFSLEFRTVDWWTKYAVGQRIARSFSVADCVFLVGDACHTHSSGAAQGLNTGLHDSVNLAWKLSFVLQGLAEPTLLYTYEAERMPLVQRLIKINKEISRLMTGQLPENWKGDPSADTNELLSAVMKEAASFNTGLGISYSSDTLLNRRSGNRNFDISSIHAGNRAPDVPLQKPATFEATRLQAQTPNIATFYVVVFGGEISHTRSLYAAFNKGVSELSWAFDHDLPIEWLSIFAGPGGQSAFDTLDGKPLGRVFYDSDCSAHKRYGIDVQHGAVVVLRPDGWVGTIEGMNRETAVQLEAYFRMFLTGMKP